MRDLSQGLPPDYTEEEFRAYSMAAYLRELAANPARMPHWPILYAILRPALSTGNIAVRQHAERLAEVLEGDQRAALRELLDRPRRTGEPARVIPAGVTEALATRQWPRDLTEAEMDALATALNEHDAGSIGFHAIVDRVLAVAQGTAGVEGTPK